MVSLDNTKNLKGGFSFESVTPIHDDFVENDTMIGNIETNNDQLPLTSDQEPNFKKIATTFVIILQIFTVVTLEVGVFMIPYLCGDKNQNCSNIKDFDLIVYIHSAYWLLKFLFDRFYHFHHMKSRRHGYLEFYRVTRLVRSLPLTIISAGNSILLVLVKILQNYCPVECTPDKLTPNNFLQIFVSLENILLLPIMIYYLKQTISFNMAKKKPDINTELERPIFSPTQLKDIGFKDSNYVTNILENQADMIRYLQERNEKLSRKLYQMNDKTNISNITNIN